MQQTARGILRGHSRESKVPARVRKSLLYHSFHNTPADASGLALTFLSVELSLGDPYRLWGDTPGHNSNVSIAR